MSSDGLTMAKALRFARHDFLNELQLVLMHIDLGNAVEAKQTIVNATDAMRQLSNLESLGLRLTEEWLLSFKWAHTAYRIILKCDCKTGTRIADDAEVAAYLKRVFRNLDEQLDTASEYEAHIDVHSSLTDWSIKIAVSGALLGQRQALEQGESFLVEEAVSHNLWTFTLSGQ